MHRRSTAILLLFALGCGPTAADPSADDGTTADAGTTAPADGDRTTTGSPTPSPVTTDDGDTTAATTTSDDTGDTTGPSCPAPHCEGNEYWECVDGLDNDGDGLVDLADPECTSPCDDDEASFLTRLPQDGGDCKNDCYFDANVGQGDDMCITDLRCDPLDPGARIGCPYTGGASCDWQQMQPLPRDCVPFCTPLTPPGCDCFGCCEIPGADVPVYLEASSDCSLDNPAACPPCTSRIDECGVACDRDACMMCIGDTAPPPGCDAANCDILGLSSCQTQCDCPDGTACQLGCCRPLPPG